MGAVCTDPLVNDTCCYTVVIRFWQIKLATRQPSASVPSLTLAQLWVSQTVTLKWYVVFAHSGMTASM